MHQLLTQEQTVALLRQLAALSVWLNDELPGRVRRAKAEGAMLMGMVSIVAILFFPSLALGIMTVVTAGIAFFTFLPFWQTVMNLWGKVKPAPEVAVSDTTEVVRQPA